MKTLTCIAPSQNPYETLALEETLLESLGPDERILLLYQHHDSVILGRNQNAWAECRHESLQAAGGVLARRISGGGAVFHDMGNLNFSFLAPRQAYNTAEQFNVLFDAVRSLGIAAEHTGRNDLIASGRKFSGNAFCMRGQAALHHGTLLIDTNIAKMEQILRVDPSKIQAKGVASVRARVVNLCELRSSLSVEDVMGALLAAYGRAYGHASELHLREAQIRRAEELARRNASWGWVFGRTPDFDLRFSGRFAWGDAEFLFNLHGAAVQHAQVYSDALHEAYMMRLGGALCGLPFRVADLSRAARACARCRLEREMAADLSDLFAAHI